MRVQKLCRQPHKKNIARELLLTTEGWSNINQAFGALLGRIQTCRDVSCNPSFQSIMKEKGCTGDSTSNHRTKASNFGGSRNAVPWAMD